MNSHISIEEWKKLLNVDRIEEFPVLTTLDLPTQRVIQADVDRTRSDLLTPAEKINLEVLLTYYCKENNISYKQGMNEIMAPFLYMARFGLPLYLVYSLFKQFVHSVLGNMFVDNEFKPLQAMFLVFRVVLRYHEPRISTFLKFNSIAPECYLTSWILTVFASKVNEVELLFCMWKEIIVENDQFFLLFISLAILQQFKSEIVVGEGSGIPSKLSSICVKDQETLQSIIKKARNLKRNMPYSSILALLKADINNLEEIDTLLIKLETQTCLTVMPREIINRAFPDSKICLCKASRCFWCVERLQTVPLVLLDCRTQELQAQGTVPNSILVKNEAFYNTDYMLEFPDQFVSMRGLYHFCLMGQSEYKGTDFEFRTTAQHEEDVIENMISNLIQIFLMKGFQYISVLGGGFERIHHFTNNFKLDLDNHRTNHCTLCEPVSKKRDIRRSSAGDVSKVSHYDQSLNIQPNKPTIIEREMQGFCHIVFFCKLEKNTNFLECCLKIGEKWVEVVLNESQEDSIKANISSLKNITILKKNPLCINLSFKDLQNVLILHLKSKEDVKKCVSQISTHYNNSQESIQKNKEFLNP